MSRTIGFLVYPDFQILDATGPVAAFEIAARYSPGAYSLVFLSRDGGMVTSSSGLAVATTALAAAPPSTRCWWREATACVRRPSAP